MSDDGISSSGRQLWDLGRFAVVLMARPLAAYLRRGPDGTNVSAQDLRRDASRRPRTQVEASQAVVERFFAWLAIFPSSLVIFIVCAFLRGLTRGEAVDLLPRSVMVVTVVTGLLASFEVLVQVGRFTLLQLLRTRAFPIMVGKGTRRERSIRHSRVARWLCTPSHIDTVTSMIWVLMFAPQIIGGFWGHRG
jgi:hypothetical protein